jgi:hypothetical protein
VSARDPIGSTDGSLAWVVGTLRRQAMPPEEIRVVVSADAATVRRYLELHRERLEEWLADERRALALIERSLVGISGRRAWRTARAPRRRRPAMPPTPTGRTPGR